MAGDPAITKLVSLARAAFLLSLSTLAACVHLEAVTARPEYASPENLISLCDQPGKIDVNNRGIYISSRDTTGMVLLSTQLLSGELAVHRHLQWPALYCG